MTPPPPISTLFPYTTLFRSDQALRESFRLHRAWSPEMCSQSRHCRFRSEEHTSELQSQSNLVCRLLLEKKKQNEQSILHPRRLGSASKYTPQPTAQYPVNYL